MMEKRDLRIGFVGLGNLGAPMAHLIAHEGWPLSLYARRHEQLDLFARTGATRVASLTELGAASDLVCVMVGHDREVDDVVEAGGLLAAIRPGGIVAIHSTVHPDTCRRLAELGRRCGVTVIDAPVAGGGAIQALCVSLGLPLSDPLLAAPGRSVQPGKLAVMVGGDPDSFERCRPVFESFGDPICLMGDAGSGQVTKLVNNLLAYANIGVAAAAFELGAKLGLDLDSFDRIVANGSAASFGAKSFAPHFRMGIHPNAQSLIGKDIRLALDLARSQGLDSHLLAEAANVTLERSALRVGE
jgi:3-hydroxyisobutyrate dehydrogenase